ncbi:hypothetical protein OHN37_40880 [Streptomyces sp. NBC_00485]|uniref:hypothetical protein n=1 Tax=Streptomyces sp. NBC_00485 TaxID=2975758 RepID=UPI002E187744
MGTRTTASTSTLCSVCGHPARHAARCARPTGGTGPSRDIPRLAEGADLFLWEATHLHRMPTADAPCPLTAGLAGRDAQQAGAA